MPKIPIVSARKLIKVLKIKGFVLHRVKGSHHTFKRIIDKKTTTVPVHPGHDLGRGLTRQILDDADISTEEFLKLL